MESKSTGRFVQMCHPVLLFWHKILLNHLVDLDNVLQGCVHFSFRLSHQPPLSLAPKGRSPIYLSGRTGSVVLEIRLSLGISKQELRTSLDDRLAVRIPPSQKGCIISVNPMDGEG